jgi:hypothetical protein
MNGGTYMKSFFTLEKNGAMKVLGLVLLCVAIVFVMGAKPASTPSPMQFKVVNVPPKVLNAVPPGGNPSNIEYTITSSAGPFCIQGLRMDPNSSLAVGRGEIGDVWINLERIDGWGLSHPYVTLVNGSTGGFSPYDLVISYGTPICGASSVTFHAIMWPATNYVGANASLSGQAIILTAPENTITIQ